LGIVFFCLVFAGMMILHALRGTHIDVGRGGNVEIHAPGGVTIRAGNAVDVGVPVYPGASSLGKGGSVQITTANEDQTGVSGANYTTPDPIEKVDAWYGERLGKDFVREGPGPKQMLVKGLSVRVETGEIAYTSDLGPSATIVSLKRTLGGGTSISLARMGSRETQ
jgi:hypothetical protein